MLKRPGGAGHPEPVMLPQCQDALVEDADPVRENLAQRGSSPALEREFLPYRAMDLIRRNPRLKSLALRALRLRSWCPTPEPSMASS